MIQNIRKSSAKKWTAKEPSPSPSESTEEGVGNVSAEVTDSESVTSQSSESKAQGNEHQSPVVTEDETTEQTPEEATEDIKTSGAEPAPTQPKVDSDSASSENVATAHPPSSLPSGRSLVTNDEKTMSSASCKFDRLLA
jgi:hypothetical protein